MQLEDLVGRKFKGHTGKTYTCTAADPCDITMVADDDPTDVRLVSDRAIGRTFHIIEADGFCALQPAPQ